MTCGNLQKRQNKENVPHNFQAESNEFVAFFAVAAVIKYKICLPILSSYLRDLRFRFEHANFPPRYALLILSVSYTIPFVTASYETSMRLPISSHAARLCLNPTAMSWDPERYCSMAPLTVLPTFPSLFLPSYAEMSRSWLASLMFARKRFRFALLFLLHIFGWRRSPYLGAKAEISKTLEKFWTVLPCFKKYIENIIGVLILSPSTNKLNINSFE